MVIEKPRTAVLNKDQTVTLYFDFDEEELRYPQGVFDVRGGVCWPVTYRKDGYVDSQGFIIVVGKNLNTGVITIFEQQQFLVVEPIRDPETQAITYHGISNFTNNAYSNYYCRKYYWHQNWEFSKKWRLDILRSPAIEPKPILMEVPWGEDQDADHLIWMKVKQQLLRHDETAELYNQLQHIKQDDKKKKNKILPAVRALQCALMGMERFPLRRQEEKGVF